MLFCLLVFLAEPELSAANSHASSARLAQLSWDLVPHVFSHNRVFILTFSDVNSATVHETKQLQSIDVAILYPFCIRWSLLCHELEEVDNRRKSRRKASVNNSANTIWSPIRFIALVLPIVIFQKTRTDNCHTNHNKKIIWAGLRVTFF